MRAPGRRSFLTCLQSHKQLLKVSECSRFTIAQIFRVVVQLKLWLVCLIDYKPRRSIDRFVNIFLSFSLRSTGEIFISNWSFAKFGLNKKIIPLNRLVHPRAPLARPKAEAIKKSCKIAKLSSFDFIFIFPIRLLIDANKWTRSRRFIGHCFGEYWSCARLECLSHVDSTLRC